MTKNTMTSSEQPLQTSTLTIRLQRFKGACTEQRGLEIRIQKLIEKRATMAVSKFHHAKREVKRVKDKARAIRAEMEQMRLTCGIEPMKNEENLPTDPILMNHLDRLPVPASFPDGGSAPSLLGGKVTQPNSFTSLQVVLSPVLSGPDDFLLIGSPLNSSSPLNIHNDDSITTTPAIEEDEECHDEVINLMVQHYIEVCQLCRALEAGIEEELEAEELQAMERADYAKNALKYMGEQAIEMVGMLNGAGGGSSFKVPPPGISTMDDKERPSEVVAPGSPPTPIAFIEERGGTYHPADERVESTDPMSSSAPRRSEGPVPDAIVESFRKYDQSLTEFFSNPSLYTIPPSSLFTAVGPHTSASATQSDDSQTQTHSPEMVEAFAGTYWKWKGGDPVCGREIMRTHWLLIRSLVLLRKKGSWDTFDRSPSGRQIQAIIDSL
jgi:hypothetical protein